MITMFIVRCRDIFLDANQRHPDLSVAILRSRRYLFTTPIIDNNGGNSDLFRVVYRDGS
jgi:hypothetical protein